MIISEKKLKELVTVLRNDDNILISEAIGLLREEQPFEGAIGILTSFYNNTDDRSIRKAIEVFMNDLKDQSVSVEVINEIRKQWNAATTSMLVLSCWQSGLDYSEYSTDLTEVFLRGDYVTAIECLTVIEESIHKLSNEKKNEILRIIDESPAGIKNEKTELRLELLSLLKR
jgi:hypothetical protein